MVVLDSKEGFLIKRMESVLETPYDNGTRRLMGICAQDLVEWLLPGAFCTGKLSEKFESFDIEADAMQETLFYDKLALVHVEFQSGPDTGMAQGRLAPISVKPAICYQPINLEEACIGSIIGV